MTRFNDLWDRFVVYQTIQKGVSPSTLKIYKQARAFFDSAFQEYESLDELDQDAPQTQKQQERLLFERLQTAIQKHMQQPIPPSPTTVIVYSRPINTFLRWLKEYAEVFQFAWKIQKQIVPTGETREAFNEAELVRIRAYKPRTSTEHRCWMIAMTMLGTGIRIQEALNLETKDVNLQDDLIFVREGKGRKSRTVPIPQELRKLLHLYIDKYTPPTCKYVFGIKTGHKLTQSNSLNDIKRVLARCGVRGLSWHCFRHTFSFGYILRGGDILKLQRILGHSKIETTMIYLNHLPPGYHMLDVDQFSSLAPIK
jgi:integrase/recombinase XerD